MKILAIIGSLRKKNTFEAVKKIEAIHKQYAACDYEYLFLKDLNLQLCAGCHMCMTKGEDFCPLKDDRDLIIKKIEESDGIILACPTFSMNVTWLMKNYMDRLSFIMHRPRFFRQKFMLLTVSGSIRGGKEALKILSFGVFGGKKISQLAILNSPGMNENKKKIQERKISQEAFKFAKNMDKRLSLKPSIVNMIWFSAFKATSSAYKDECTADYDYYHDKEYFIEVGLSKIQRITINIFTGIFTYFVKKGIV